MNVSPGAAMLLIGDWHRQQQSRADRRIYAAFNMESSQLVERAYYKVPRREALRRL